MRRSFFPTEASLRRYMTPLPTILLSAMALKVVHGCHGAVTRASAAATLPFDS